MYTVGCGTWYCRNNNKRLYFYIIFPLHRENSSSRSDRSDNVSPGVYFLFYIFSDSRDCYKVKRTRRVGFFFCFVFHVYYLNVCIMSVTRKTDVLYLNRLFVPRLVSFEKYTRTSKASSCYYIVCIQRACALGVDSFVPHCKHVDNSFFPSDKPVVVVVYTAVADSTFRKSPNRFFYYVIITFIMSCVLKYKWQLLCTIVYTVYML